MSNLNVLQKMETYKVVGKLSFNLKTDDRVCLILNKLHLNRHRVKLTYGNIETGKSWNDVYDTIGTIGRSTGTYKIPLLIKTVRSMGGCGILDSCILKITDLTTNTVLYVHPNFKQSKIEIVLIEDKNYPFEIQIDNVRFTKHKTKQSAKIMYNKLFR
jgi:hypothetical protein